MRQPGTFNLALYKGDSYSWVVRCWADELRTTPADLTGVTPKAEIRPKAGANPATVISTAVTLPNLITCTIPVGLWPSMPPKGVWDLQLTYSDGRIETLLKGSVSITVDVTDSVTA